MPSLDRFQEAFNLPLIIPLTLDLRDSELEQDRDDSVLAFVSFSFRNDEAGIWIASMLTVSSFQRRFQKTEVVVDVGH